MSAQTRGAGVVEDWISEPYRGLRSDSAYLLEIRAALDEHGLVELPGLPTPAAHTLLTEPDNAAALATYRATGAAPPNPS